MKKFYIGLMVQLMVSVAMAQGCLPDGITFTTQEEIDNFQVNYPGCSVIEGDVHIFGANNTITNLEGLSVLNAIGGNLVLDGCDDLNNLEGLENLTSIGGSLICYGAQSLTSLTGLESLNTLGAGLNIQWCGSLRSLNGLENLTNIGSYGIVLFMNHKLQEITALSNLTSEFESLSIENNDSLTSLAGLENIPMGSVENLYITDNHLLTNCEIEGLCSYLASPTGVVNIHDNAPGCNNPREVADGCGITLPCLPFGTYYVASQAEADNFEANYPDCHDLTGGLMVSGDNIRNLAGLSHLKSINGSLSFLSNDSLINFEGLDSLVSISGDLAIGYWEGNENQGLVSLAGLENLATIGGSLSIIQNESLTSLEGLSSLTAIEGSLEVVYDNVLVSLAGMDSLTSVGQDINIGGNDALPDLNGLEKLAAVGGDIWIGNNLKLASISGLENIDAGTIESLHINDNPFLSSCEVQSVCDYLSVPDANAAILENAPGCNSREEVEAACGLGIEVVAGNGGLRIYPNPADGYVLVESLEVSKSKHLYIQNMSGEQMVEMSYAGYSKWIDVSSLPEGLYILKVIGEKTVQTGKFVKQ